MFDAPHTPFNVDTHSDNRTAFHKLGIVHLFLPVEKLRRDHPEA